MEPTNPSTKGQDRDLIIEAGGSEQHYWLDLWRYRELLWFLAWRDVKIRYKQTVLGVAWAIIQPAVQTALLAFVFGKLAKMPDGGVPYPLIVLTGLIPWQLFASAFSGAGNSLVGNSHLISKVYFPRLVIPMSAIAVSMVDVGILLMLTIPLVLFFGISFSWHLLLLPLFLLHTVLIALGAGLWITALTVKFRDFRFISPFILQIGLFVTPVGFRTDFLATWKDILALNPLSSVVDGIRWCLLAGNNTCSSTSYIISAIMTSALLLSGIWYFRKTERQFADII